MTLRRINPKQVEKPKEVEPKVDELLHVRRYGPFYLMINREEIHRIIYQCCNVELVDFYKNQAIVDTLRGSKTDTKERNRDIISSFGSKSLQSDKKMKLNDSFESDTLLRNSIEEKDRNKGKEMNLLSDYLNGSGSGNTRAIIHGEFKFVNQVETLKQSIDETLSEKRFEIS